MDMMPKECDIEPVRYKDEVRIPKLSFVDDLVDIHICGKETKLMNIHTSEQIDKRRLHFAVDKCNRLHIGPKNVENTKCEPIYVNDWEEANSATTEDVLKGKYEVKTVERQE